MTFGTCTNWGCDSKKIPLAPTEAYGIASNLHAGAYFQFQIGSESPSKEQS